MASAKLFKISVPQEKIDALKQKLSLTQFPDELEASGWDLGSPLNDIKRLTKAWEQFDWRQAENKLNETPQFTTDIDVAGFGTLNIHFVHQTSKVTGAVPLLFVHGCKLSELHPIYYTEID
jgi:microsomal epoxide hydrolase